MITKTLQGERLLQIDNAHVASCGPPPSLDASDEYVGYFENEYGEQWVFIGDPETGKARLFGGDVHWEKRYDVSLKSPCPPLVLTESERLWIITCFMAMSETPLDEMVRTYNQAAQQRHADVERMLDEE